MAYDYFGLVLEFVFLALGIYIYLFAIGKVKSKDPEKQSKAEQFRLENQRWMRLLGLALTAVMTVNIYLHIVALMK